MKNTPKSILVIGTDYTGKTSLIESINKELVRRGHEVIVNKNDLFKSGIYSKAEEMMKNDWEGNELAINSLLAMAFFVDAEEYKLDENKILLQDSYFFRTMAFCDAYGIPYITNLLEKYQSHLFSFDCIILLSASNEEKMKRLRQGQDLFDKDILTNHELSKKMDDSLEKYVNTSKNFIHIDTTNLTLNEVFEKAINFIDGGLK